jgi:hypothetical protein
VSRLLRSPSFITSIVIGAIMIGAILESREFSAAARFVPSLFAWITLGLVIVDLARQLLPVLREMGAKERKTQDRGNVPTTAPPESALRVILFVLAFWILVLLFGFYGIPALLIWAYLAIEARIRWYVAIAAAALGNLGILWGMSALGVSIWQGSAPEIWPDMIGGEGWPIF